MLPRAAPRRSDRFCYAEIFYAGGTVARDVSSRMLADDLPAALRCGYAPDHARSSSGSAREARPGDTVLIMGARDPDLPALARGGRRRPAVTRPLRFPGAFRSPACIH